MSAGSLEALVTIQLIYLIAALGHYLPLSMKQLDLGIAGYFAIGAYTSAFLTRDCGFSFALALIAGSVAAAAGAFVVDALATRVRLTGFAYAIFSLSFAESLRVILNNVEALGSSGGFVGIPSHTTFATVAVIAAAVLSGFWWLDRTRLGHLRTAIADDEFIVAIFGVPLTSTKLTIFAIGGALGGLAGGLYSHYVLFIRPDDFGFALLIGLQLPMVFGGLDRFYGAVVGLLLLGFIPEFVRELAQYRLIVMAAATLLVLILRPSGLITHQTIAWSKDGFRRLIGIRVVPDAKPGPLS